MSRREERIPELKEKAQGFMGADLELLVKEAAMIAIREILPTIDLSQSVPPKVLFVEFPVIDILQPVYILLLLILLLLHQRLN